jgi:hypothetical protein
MGVRRVSLLVVPIIAAAVLDGCGEKTYEVGGEVVTASRVDATRTRSTQRHAIRSGLTNF